MKVKSKLADIDFEFGRFEYKKDHLIVHSHESQSMQSKVYVSPNDVLSAAGKALANPMVWVYLLFLTSRPYPLGPPEVELESSEGAALESGREGPTS